MLSRHRFSLIMLMTLCAALFFLSGAKGVVNLHRLALATTLDDVKKSTLKELPANSLVESQLDLPYLLPSFFLDLSERSNYNAWMAYVNRDDEKQWQLFNQRALNNIEEQQKKRPLDSTLVIQKANIMWRLDAPHSDILEQYRLAVQLGEFERYTLINTLIFYLSSWPELESVDRKVAVSYLLDMKRYKMKNWQYDQILKMPLVGERACAIYSFNNVRPYFCR
ncbi:hypothetical protein DZ860_14600 [Vibrio sinensis]|uniref:Uncharacterized protein n=1 Tax=Vibrio sinensis TaxID=2302434 RepID=A0A3A6QPW4_9VIBR|nr:hypothetical protein [Vibrio sinensis]RJX69706.1 hypothetical protein DZ860_14600 [Vibrio sinensis]